jgi:threonine/homoserine/homoserine lactone efflux protein
MNTLFRILAVLCVLVAAVLIYAVIAALGSDGGAKPVVAVLYIVGSIVLGYAAIRLWRGPSRRPAQP